MKLRSRMIVPKELVDIGLSTTAYREQHESSMKLRAEHEGLKIGEIHMRELGLKPACMVDTEETKYGDSYITDFEVETS